MGLFRKKEKPAKRSGQKNMLRTVNVKEITAAIKEMCIEANQFLSEDMAARMKKAVDEEEAPLGKLEVKYEPRFHAEAGRRH